jgi:hypothetical protein
MLRLVSLAFIAFCISSASTFYAFEKIITVTVTAKQEVSIDGIRIDNIDNLSVQVQQRLWRSYMGNGKMPGLIRIQFEPDVAISVRSLVFGATRQGQEKTLTVLSLEKYKKRFENISSKQQDKLKKKFPVLFQQTFPTS